MYLDLHMHTTVSDGRLTPTELIDLAAKRDLRIVAMTDHDTTEGLAEGFARKARYPQLTIIPGIELSTDIPGSEVHVLGYFLNFEAPLFQAKLKDFREKRVDRGEAMVQKLRELGVMIEWERVQELAQGSVGRPHVAQAMLEAGYINSINEAFDRYIGRNGPAYAERAKLTPVEAVEMIKSVQGVAVLAHPKDVLQELNPILDDLCAAGLTGMEAYYQGYAGEVQDYLLDECYQRGLIPCGGSDFHGIEGREEVGLGRVDVPLTTAERLYAAAGQRLPERG